MRISFFKRSSISTLPAPQPQPVSVDAQEVGKGIWWLAGNGNARSILFEFDDHLTLFDHAHRLPATSTTHNNGSPATNRLTFSRYSRHCRSCASGAGAPWCAVSTALGSLRKA